MYIYIINKTNTNGGGHNTHNHMKNENESLINAAPDMLAALKEINEWVAVNFPEHGMAFEYGTCPTFNRVRAAISKAKSK